MDKKLNRKLSILNFLILFFMVVLFANCKKDKEGPYKIDQLYGEWKLDMKFWDLDSNGLDSGDIKYLANPNDSITWLFRKDRWIEYKDKGVPYLMSQWGLNTVSKNEKSNTIYFSHDADGTGYFYHIQNLNDTELVIFSKQFVTIFSKREIRWYGYKLHR